SDRYRDSRTITVDMHLALRHRRENSRRLNRCILLRPDFQNPRRRRSPHAIDDANVTQNAQRRAADCFQHRFDLERNEMTTDVCEKHRMGGYDLARRRPLHGLHRCSVLSVSHFARCQIEWSFARPETTARAPRDLFEGFPYRVAIAIIAKQPTQTFP